MKTSLWVLSTLWIALALAIPCSSVVAGELEKSLLKQWENDGIDSIKQYASIQTSSSTKGSGTATIEFTVKIRDETYGDRWVAVGGFSKNGKKFIKGIYSGKRYFAFKQFEGEKGDTLTLKMDVPMPNDYHLYYVKIAVLPAGLLESCRAEKGAKSVEDVIPLEVGDRTPYSSDRPR